MKKLIAFVLVCLSFNSLANDFSYVKGDRIINDYGFPGTIVGIYPDGKALIVLDGYTSYSRWPTFRLAVTRGCVQYTEYCVGRTVVDDYGFEAVIGGVYQDGYVAISYVDQTHFRRKTIDRLLLL